MSRNKQADKGINLTGAGSGAGNLPAAADCINSLEAEIERADRFAVAVSAA